MVAAVELTGSERDLVIGEMRAVIMDCDDEQVAELARSVIEKLA